MRILERGLKPGEGLGPALGEHGIDRIRVGLAFEQRLSDAADGIDALQGLYGHVMRLEQLHSRPAGQVGLHMAQAHAQDEMRGSKSDDAVMQEEIRSIARSVAA